VEEGIESESEKARTVRASETETERGNKRQMNRIFMLEQHNQSILEQAGPL
jgi:hypothetical protein